MSQFVQYHQATWIFKPVIQFAREKGITEVEISEVINSSLENLLKCEEQVDYKLLDGIMLLILKKTNDKCVGLELGYNKNMLSGHYVDYLIRSCNKVFDIARKIEEHNLMLSNFSYLQVSENDDLIFIRILASENWVFKYPVSSRLVRDFILAFIVKLLIDYSNGYTIPLKIQINNQYIFSDSRMEKVPFIFEGISLLYNDHDCIVYEKGRDADMITANEMIQKVIESKVFQHFGLSANPTSMAYKVKAQLLSMGEKILSITIHDIANINQLSDRRLQQLLQKEGTNFRQILNEVKVSTIKKLLLNPATSVKSSSISVGYSNPTSLQFYFKKKTGKTPGEFNGE